MYKKLFRHGSTILVMAWVQMISFSLNAQKPSFRVIAFYSTHVEKDHVQFAGNALAFFTKLSKEKHFQFDSTSDWSMTNDEFLKNYQVVLWINEFPNTEDERRAFERYMNHGGAWLGFHVSGYNDKDTHWPWFVDFMGGAVFYTNNWPPLPAKLIIDKKNHPVTKNMPASYRSPINEWYQWKPSPRLNKNVQVLVSLDSSNYPLGKKDIIYSGDLPVVWTNTRYKMLYLNMGHGDQVLTDPIQNKMISNALSWLATSK
jgi:type 1 glutamine amidotransferase